MYFKLNHSKNSLNCFRTLQAEVKRNPNPAKAQTKNAL